MEYQQASRLIPRVPKGVWLSRRHEDERPCRALEYVVTDVELDESFQDEVRLVVADVTVRRRHSPARWQGSLHQGEPPLRVSGSGLEPHFASARLTAQAVTTLPTTHGSSEVSVGTPRDRD